MIGLAILAIGFELSLKFTPEISTAEYGGNFTLQKSDSVCFTYG